MQNPTLLPKNITMLFKDLGQALTVIYDDSELLFLSPNLKLSFKSDELKALEDEPKNLPNLTFPVFIRESKIGHLYFKTTGSNPDLKLLNVIVENFCLKLELFELKAEANFANTVLDNMHEAVVACDENGILKLFNKKAHQLHGLPEEDIPATEWAQHYDLYYGDEKEPMEMKDIPLYRALTGETVKDAQMVIAPKGQTSHHILSNAHPLMSHDDKKVGAIAVMRDETELKQQLKAAELRFQTIFDQFPLSIQICSPDGKTILVNEAWKKLWHISEKVIQSYILKDYIMLEDPILKAKGLIPYIERGFTGEITHIPIINYNTQEAGLDGRARMVEGLMFPLKDSNDKINEIILIHTDVTEKEIQRSRESLLDKLSSILITTLDYDQVIAKISDACLPDLADGCIIDLVKEDTIQRIITKHRDPQTQTLLEELQKSYPPRMNSPQPAARVIRSGQPEIMRTVDHSILKAHTFDLKHVELIEKIGLRSNIAVPLIIRGQTIGSLGLFITTDRPIFNEEDLDTAIEVARRASLAIENAELYLKAQKAILQRDEFISIASHELKTPITSMKLQLQLADRMMAKNEDGKVEASYLKKVTNIANKQLNRITVLVEDMLDITRISSGKLPINLQETNVSKLVTEILSRLCDELGHLSTLLTSDIQNEVIALCDGFRIEQVLTNLLTNAIRYGEKKPIRVELSQDEFQVCIKVIDQGSGIAQVDQERIFERFERAVSASNISGMGLGLFISRQIMEQHQGTLTLESALGKGSTFLAKFPKRMMCG